MIWQSSICEWTTLFCHDAPPQCIQPRHAASEHSSVPITWSLLKTTLLNWKWKESVCCFRSLPRINSQPPRKEKSESRHENDDGYFLFRGEGRLHFLSAVQSGAKFTFDSFKIDSGIVKWNINRMLLSLHSLLPVNFLDKLFWTFWEKVKVLFLCLRFIPFQVSSFLSLFSCYSVVLCDGA